MVVAQKDNEFYDILTSEQLILHVNPHYDSFFFFFFWFFLFLFFFLYVLGDVFVGYE